MFLFLGDPRDGADPEAGRDAPVLDPVLDGDVRRNGAAEGGAAVAAEETWPTRAEGAANAGEIRVTVAVDESAPKSLLGGAS